MTSADTLTLLACQIAIPPMTTAKERDAHLQVSVDKVRDALKAADRKVNLVVLPELSSIDYDRATFARLDEIAEPLDRPNAIGPHLGDEIFVPALQFLTDIAGQAEHRVDAAGAVKDGPCGFEHFGENVLGRGFAK